MSTLSTSVKTVRKTLATSTRTPLRAASTSQPAARAPAPAPAPARRSPSPPKTHYLVTLLRSPLHLPAPVLATCESIGLSHRLSSSIVPITRENAGFILRIKELVGVRTVGVDEVAKASEPAWRDRPGEGRQGGGFLTKGDPGRGVIRVSRERARGDERGFRVVR